MTAASLFRDITAFSVQIALVGLGLAVLLKLVRIPAGVRFFGLRLALVASLVVPWLLRAPEVQAPARATAATPLASLLPFSEAGAPTMPQRGAAAAEPSEPAAIPWTQVGFGALLIGIAARVVWLGVGVVRLLRMRHGGVVVDAPEYSELQQQLGTRATITQVQALSQPATFGVRRPVVLLPDALAVAPASLRRAVVTHELFHVRRRDWLSVLGEEMVRTALWFHPAILWMTSQIQLAREEIVDELTVQATGDRRTYVEALLAFADTPGLSPAPAFAHRRQLFHRILSVSKEKVMSRPRMLSSAAVLLTAVVGASWYASTLFPILKAAKAEVQASAPPAAVDSAPAQSDSRVVLAGNVVVRTGDMTLRAAEVRLEQQTGNALAIRPITPENPIPRRTRGVAPVTPSQYASAQVVVSARVTVDRNGAVMSVDPDSCSASGGRNDAAVCAAFQDVTAAAVRQWRYDRPAQAPIQFYVRVAFRPGAEIAIAQSGESYLREPQDSLRRLETDKDNATVQRAVASLQADLARVTDMSRELERAQRSAIERGFPNTDVVKVQQELARLNAEMAQAEAQLRSARAQQSNGERSRDDARIAALMQQVRETQRELERGNEQVRANLDAQARAEEQGRAALAERLRETQQRLETVRAQLERTGTVTGNAPPATTDRSPLVSPSGRAPLRVTPPVTAPVPIKMPKPQHSAEAMRARVEGTVTIEALVDERGRVADARVVRSIPLLDESALAAAKQWEFKPALLNGEPVPVLIMLELNFSLRN